MEKILLHSTGTTVVTDANNHNTTYTYDSQDRVTQALDALNHTRATTYTPNDDVSQTTDALSQQTNFTFDVNNNVTSATDASGDKTSFGYTDTTHPYYANSQTDAQGNAVGYTYDSAGNLTTSQDGLSSQNTVTNTYNTNGTMATAKDADGNTTTYGYDSHGNLTTVTPPSPLGAEKLTYDGASRVITFTDGKNQKTTYTYDNLDRITKITYADNSTVVYTYDDDSNLTSIVDSTGTTSFTYDNVNQQVSRSVPNTSGSQLFGYSYDAVGNLSELTNTIYETRTVINLEDVTYTYNAVNLLSSSYDKDNLLTLNYTYDNDNRRTGVTYPNGVTMTTAYDATGHETGITAKNSGGATLTSFTYSYTNPATGKAAKLRYSVTDANNTTTTYSYDALNRLTKASTSGTNYTMYAYDGNGNRTHTSSIPTHAGSAVSYMYNAANELTQVSPSGVGPITYTYDGDGNQTGTGSSQSFTYNAKNQTTSITPFGQSAIPYTYIGGNQADRMTAGGTTFDYSALGLNDDSTATYYRDNQGQLTYEYVNGTGNFYYYLFDGLGSIVGLADGSGNLVASYQYDAFGNLITSTGSVSNPWRYAGGYYDSATGLYKFGERYYNPSLGRWTQQDPIGGSLFDPSTGNHYAYANADPTNLTDPNGTNAGGCALSIFSAAFDIAVVGADVIAPEDAGLFIFAGLGIAAASTVVSVTGNPSPLNTFASFGSLVAEPILNVAGLFNPIAAVAGAVTGIASAATACF